MATVEETTKERTFTLHLTEDELWYVKSVIGLQKDHQYGGSRHTNNIWKAIDEVFKATNKHPDVPGPWEK